MICHTWPPGSKVPRCAVGRLFGTLTHEDIIFSTTSTVSIFLVVYFEFGVCQMGGKVAIPCFRLWLDIRHAGCKIKCLKVRQALGTSKDVRLSSLILGACWTTFVYMSMLKIVKLSGCQVWSLGHVEQFLFSYLGSKVTVYKWKWHCFFLPHHHHQHPCLWHYSS